jgi:hypothetical protein
VDESRDVTNKGYVVAFVRFANDEIHENFFCYKEMSGTSKGRALFNIVFSYLETKGLSLETCVGICTDGAPSLLAPSEISTSQYTTTVTQRCWFQELLEMK